MELYCRQWVHIWELTYLKKNILASAATARYGILITHVWQGGVLPTVLLTAGLQTVPQELTEAAYIDGATQMAGISDDHYPVSTADLKCCVGTGAKRWADALRLCICPYFWWTRGSNRKYHYAGL